MRNTETKRPILVTGAHRSGTTWVGKMIALDPSVVYVHEPFNANENRRLWSLDPDHWFEYLDQQTGSTYEKQIDDIVQLNFGLTDVARKVQGEPSEDGRASTLSNYLMDYKTCLWGRMQGAVPLIKDPIAVLSAEWLAETWDMRVITMVRHPAAFAGSLKVKGWSFNFSNLLDQPRLIDGPLALYAEEIRAFAHEDRDLIDQASLLWRIIYSVVHGYSQRHDDWIFLKHEDIARASVASFESLYEALGLPFTPEIRSTVRDHSATSGDSRIQRDSRSVVRNWEERLTREEVRRVRAQTESEASLFYDDSDW